MKTLLKLLKFIGVALLIYIIISLDIHKVVNVFKSINIKLVLLYTVLYFIFFFAKIYRWHLVQNSFSRNLGYKNNLIINIEALYLGFVTPGRVGDAIKVLLMKDYFDIPKKKGLVVYLFDRLQDVFFLVLIALLGIIFVVDYDFPDIVYCLFGLIILTYFFKNYILNFLLKSYDIEEHMTLDLFLEMKLLFFNMVIYSFYFMQVFVLAKSMGFTIGFIYLSSVVAIAGILALVPISILGIGIREGVFIYFLAEVGINKECAVILSLLDNVIFVIIFSVILHFCNLLIFKKNFSEALKKA